MGFNVLSFLIWLPVAAAAIVIGLPRRRPELVVPVAFALSLLTFGLAGFLVVDFDAADAGFQFVEKTAIWSDLGIDYHLGVDGISLFLVALTAFLLPDRDRRLGSHRAPPQGIHGDSAAAGRRPHRSVPQPRSHPVLRVLRGPARPDVLPDRTVGRRAPVGGCPQVLPVHGLRLGLPAGRNHLPVGAGQRSVRQPDLQLPRAARPRHLPDRPVLAVRGLRDRLRHQGAAVPVPHLAARRPHRGADGRLGDPGRRAPEDGDLRLPPVQPEPVPGGHGAAGRLPGGAGGGRHHLRRRRRHRPARPQAAGRLLVGQPPRLRRARHLRPHLTGPVGRRHPDGQPRPHHRCVVPAGRHDLRTAPHPGHLRLRRHPESDAAGSPGSSCSRPSPRPACPA